jgi:hypothetical protein
MHLRQSRFWYLLALLNCAGLCINVDSLNASPVRFTSRYTDLQRDCRNLASQMEPGQDIPQICPGPSSYWLRIDYSAVSTQIRVVNNQFERPLNIKRDCLTKYGRKVEWRLANSVPFAVMVRIRCTDPNSANVGEYLIVRGLARYETIQQDLNARTRQANRKARNMADSFYRKRN